ncbi:MAG: 50S ribosomal protein L11 methyltransferase [Thermoplasmata archaeon]|nr:50S ribosomal protein L11 methyltransferase [Thermoplasmata archaeon]
MRRSDLIRRLETVPPFAHPRSDLEQLVTPSEASVELLDTARRTVGLEDSAVTDLGCGTGRLAIGAALLGAAPVVGVDVDPESLTVARAAAKAASVTVEFVESDVTGWDTPTDVVVMNPPFGAQRRHADRPFWDAGFRVARRAVFAFSLAESRTFIARRAVARGARIIETHPIPWSLARSLPHHTHARVPISVDLWAIETGVEP